MTESDPLPWTGLSPLSGRVPDCHAHTEPGYPLAMEPDCRLHTEPGHPLAMEPDCRPAQGLHLTAGKESHHG
jgi:hypothetical protein